MPLFSFKKKRRQEEAAQQSEPEEDSDDDEEWVPSDGNDDDDDGITDDEWAGSIESSDDSGGGGSDADGSDGCSGGDDEYHWDGPSEQDSIRSELRSDGTDSDHEIRAAENDAMAAGQEKVSPLVGNQPLHKLLLRADVNVESVVAAVDSPLETQTKGKTVSARADGHFSAGARVPRRTKSYQDRS